MQLFTHRRVAGGVLVGALALAGVACGDDDDEASTTTTEAEEETTTAGEDAEAETVEVTAVDYSFEGVPDTLAAGTQLSVTNEGAEPHELVAFRIPDDESRSLEEILAAGPEAIEAVFGAGEPATVILAAP